MFVCETLYVAMTMECEVRSPPPTPPNLGEVQTVDTLFQMLQALNSGMFLMCRKVSGDIGIKSYNFGVPKVLCN